MIKEFLANHALLGPVLAGLLLFSGLFAAIILWIFRKGAKDTYNNIAKLPLESED